MYFLYRFEDGKWVPVGDGTPHHHEVVACRKAYTQELGEPILCQMVRFGRPISYTLATLNDKGHVDVRTLSDIVQPIFASAIPESEREHDIPHA